MSLTALHLRIHAAPPEGTVPDHPVVLVAGKTAAETFWTKFFEPYAGRIYVTTDDGSQGINTPVV